jgi:CBS domain-containing protein
MHVGQLCNRDVVTLSPHAKVASAAQLMRDRHVGYLVIIEPDFVGASQRAIGVLTDRDIVVEVVARGLDPRQVLVRDVMSPNPVTIALTESITAAAQEMRRLGVRRLPVVDSLGELQGVLALDDILDCVSGELRNLAGAIHNEQQFEAALYP